MDTDSKSFHIVSDAAEMINKFVYVSIISLFLCSTLYSQILIKGKVFDNYYHPIAGANIKDTNSTVMTETDTTGCFSIELTGGKHILLVSHVGYKSIQLGCLVSNMLSPLYVKLEEGIPLDEIEISAKSVEHLWNDTRSGVCIEASEISQMPMLLGEPDVLKRIQSLAGVQFTSEGSIGYSVRGSAPDQNLILLDNCTLYNASHLAGFLSSFNNDIVKNAIFYKNDLPVQYGNRISSVLDISTVSDLVSKPTWKGGIGLLATRLSVQTPLNNKVQLVLAARRSYADLFFKFLKPQNVNKSVLYFYDLNMKLMCNPTSADKLFFSVYRGRDRAEIESFLIDYGNDAFSLTWKHSSNSNVLMKGVLSYSNFEYNIKSNWEVGVIDWKSNLYNLRGGLDFTYLYKNNNSIIGGINIAQYNFHPCKISGAGYLSYEISNSHATEAYFYLSGQQMVSRAMSLNYGIRGTIYKNKCGYTSIDPQLSGVLNFSEMSSLKMSYNYNSQFIQWANRSSSGSPLDVWIPASLRLKPLCGRSFILGYYLKNVRKYLNIAVELYYKKVRNVMDFYDNTSLLFNEHIEDFVDVGNSFAYGVEFSMKKKFRNHTLITNYSYSHARYKIPAINGGESYRSPYNIPHSFNFYLISELSSKCNIAVNWVYSSGRPGTFPSSGYQAYGVYLPVYSGRNHYKYPDYHRLDVSLTYYPTHKIRKSWKDKWVFSFYNLYARKNPWSINFKKGQSSMVYLFNVVPSITYNFEF